MNRLFRFVLVAVGFISTMSMAQNEYTVVLPYQEVVFEAKNGVAVFTGASIYGESGEPALPTYCVQFLLPPNADPENVSVTIEQRKELTIPEVISVDPVPPRMALNGSPIWPAGKTIVDGKDITIYGRDAFFPQANLGQVSFGKQRQYNLVSVAINPFLYNPYTRTLCKLTGGVLKVTVSGLVQKATTTVLPFAGSMEKTILSQVANADVINEYGIQAEAATLATSLKIAPMVAGDGYVIVTTNTIRANTASFQALVDHKTAKGFKVTVATETQWGGGTGNTAADNIRDWLKNNYMSQNIRYVLLIGDPHPVTGTVPMKECYLQNGSTYSNPTDYYFAELSGNWDVDRDGKYGEYGDDFNAVGGPDKYAEVAVGRIPFYGNYSDLNKILQKIIRYGNETDRGWRKFALLPMEPLGPSQSGHELGEQIKNDLLLSRKWDYFRLYDQVNCYTGFTITGVANLNPPPEAFSCTIPNVLDAWTKNDVGVVVWSTHGSMNNAVDILSSADAPALDDNHPSMTFQASCDNGYPEVATNLGYSLLVNGAITTVSASRNITLPDIGESFPHSMSSAGMGYDYATALVRDTMECGVALNAIKAPIAVVSDYGWRNWVVTNLYGCPDQKLDIDPAIPASPTNLTAISVSTTQINLNWSDNATNETGFRIERAASTGDFAEIETVASNVTAYQNTGLTNGAKYRYRVRAYAAQSSSYSNVDSSTTYTNSSSGKTATASTEQTDNTPAKAVDGSTTTRWCASNSAVPQWLKIDMGGSVAMSGSEIMWEAANAGYKYTIETSTDNATWTIRADLSSNTSAAQTQTQSFSATARYVRINISALPAGSWASVFEFRVFSNPVPAAPTEVSAVGADASVNLVWSAVAGAVSYTVKRGLSISGPFITVATGISGTTYFDPNLVPQQTYYFTVSAVNASGRSVPSGVVSAVPAGSAILAPSGLTNNAYELIFGFIHLRWIDNSDNETGFLIERAGANNVFSEIGTQVQNEYFYSDTTTVPNTTYKYRVRATDGGSYSAYSEIFTVTLPNNPPPAAPSNLNGTLNGTSSINLRWQLNSTDYWTVILERSVNGGSFDEILVGSSGRSQLDWSPVSPGYTYSYRVRGHNNYGYSGYSNTLTITVPGGTQYTLTTSATNGTISLIPAGGIYASGTVVSVTATPNSGFTFAGWSGDLSGTTSPTTITMNADKSVAATFSQNTTDPCAGIVGGGAGLTGTMFGLTQVYAPGTEYCKASDGNINTFYDPLQANAAFVGIDLATAKVVNRIRFHPRATFGGRMNGGKFQGSNISATTGFVDLYTIPATPAVQWNDVTVADTTGYRYVRYLSPVNGYCNIAEMEFYTNTPTPTNIAIGKTVSASTEETAKTNFAAKANDDSTTTRWCASNGTVSQWWKVDLGASYTLTGTQVVWEAAKAGYYYTIETSSDNVTWTTRADLTSNASAAQTQSQEFSATARYVRITTTGLPAGSWASFFEFRVLGY